MNNEAGPKAPWHLWAVGVVALLWYLSGAVTIFMAQADLLPNIPADERAYYAAQPFWFKAVTDIATIASVVGSVLLLMRSGKAVRAFALSLAAILVTHAYDLAMGTSRAFNNAATMIVTATILVGAILVLWYSSAMRAKGVLR